MSNENNLPFIACSDCFLDQGLRLDADKTGDLSVSKCPRCDSVLGRKLTADRLRELAYRFFVWGSTIKTKFGAAPVIQFNEHQETSISVSSWLAEDIELFEGLLGVGFFHYGPRLWMIGQTEILDALRDTEKQPKILNRIFKEYPTRKLDSSTLLYRVRKAPGQPDADHEYDSPPDSVSSHGRLDSENFPTLYASEHLDICVHESRFTAEDELFVATLHPSNSLKMLDLTALLIEEKLNEFESLDIAVHMLFLAGSHAYPITRSLSVAARDQGYDGIIYPSYFSLMRNGIMPFRTSYGISNRLLPSQQEYEKNTAVPNVAIFGRPIQSSKLEVKCINRLVLTQISYNYHFGPVTD